MEERKQLVQAVALSSNLSDRVQRCRSERPENRCCICPREAEWEKYVRGCQGARSVVGGRLLRQEWLGLQDLAESRKQAVERQKEQKLVLQDIVRVHEVFFGVGNNTFVCGHQRGARHADTNASQSQNKVQARYRKSERGGEMQIFCKERATVAFEPCCHIRSVYPATKYVLSWQGVPSLQAFTVDLSGSVADVTGTGLTCLGCQGLSRGL